MKNKKNHYNYNVNKDTTKDNNENETVTAENITAEKLFSAEKTPPLSASTTDTNSHPWRTFIVFATGGIIGALVMYLWGGNIVPPVFVSSKNNKSETSTTTVLETKPTVATSTIKNTGLVTGNVVRSDTSGAVSVEAQPAGDSVIVESVTVPPPGVWVAVQETQGDKLGNVLGATRVHGPLSNVVVSLLRNTKPNRTYAVVLYRDGGDGGVFDLSTDSVYVDFDSGKRVVVPFRTTTDSANTISAHL